MNKRKALKLKAGDVIAYRHHLNFAKGLYQALGEVLFVTPKGGIRVKQMGMHPRESAPPREASVGAPEAWVPYHFVYQIVWRQASKRSGGIGPTPMPSIETEFIA